MKRSVHLDAHEDLLLERLAGVNRLNPNAVLRLALRHLATAADRDGRLPLLGRQAARQPRVG